MANKKFSEFTSQAMTSASKLVGIDGTANTIYTVGELQTGILTNADNSILTNSAGYLTSVPSINLTSGVNGILPITNGGTGYNNGYKSVQVFTWTAGNPAAYNNLPNGSATKIPFNTVPTISIIQPSTLTNAQWVCQNSGGTTFPGIFATFTLGSAGGGLWKVRTAQHWFDQTNQVEVRASLIINSGTPIDIVDEKSTELTSDKIFYGELIYNFSDNATLELEMEFTGGNVSPFPSASGQRPPEISFERLI